MATVIPIYVDPDASGAGNGTSWTDAYTSLNAALVAESSGSPNNLTGANLVANDEIGQFICRSSAGTADTTLIAGLANYTTDATRFLIAIPDGSDLVDSIWSNSKYRLSLNGFPGINLNRDMLFVGLQMEGSDAVSSDGLIAISAGGAGYREFVRCFIRKTAAGGSGDLGIYWQTNIGARISNCILQGWNTALANARTGGVSYLYNNTFVNNGVAMGWGTASADLVVAKNNLLSGNTTDAEGTFAAGTNYNRTSNGSIGYTVTGSGNSNDAVSQTFMFIDAGGGNFGLQSGDTGAKDQGVDLSGDANYPISVDIRGYTRSGSWDVGAFEEGATADSTPPTFSSAPAVTDTTTTGHTISATINENGNVHCVRLPNGADPPSSAQVKAGQDATGSSTGVEYKTAAATADVNVDLVFNAASPATPYDYYYAAEDELDNLQSTPTLVEGTTQSLARVLTLSLDFAAPGTVLPYTTTNFNGAATGVTVNGQAGALQNVTAGGGEILLDSLSTFVEGGTHQDTRFNTSVDIVLSEAGGNATDSFQFVAPDTDGPTYYSGTVTTPAGDSVFPAAAVAGDDYLTQVTVGTLTGLLSNGSSLAATEEWQLQSRIWDVSANGGNGRWSAIRTVGFVISPTVVLTGPGGGTQAGQFNVSVVFSEIVTGLTAGDFVITNGAAVGLSGVGTTYTLTVLPTSESSGNVLINLPAGSCIDATGNGNIAASELSVPFNTTTGDVTNPSVTLFGPSGTQFQQFNVTVAFDEPVAGLVSGDFQVVNASIVSLSGSAASYTLVLLPTPNSSGNITVQLPAATCSDAAGNPNNVSNQLTIPFDTVAPGVSLSGPAGTQTGQYSITVTLSEAMTGLTASDFSVSNGSQGALTGSGLSRSLVIIPPASSSGVTVIQLPAGVATDTAGNPNSASNILNIAFSTAPANAAPVFNDATLNVSEALPIGSTVGILTATDPELEDIQYTIDSGNSEGKFYLEPDTGVLTLQSALDFDLINVYTLIVRATDESLNSDTAQITINVLEYSENQPPIVQDSAFTISETANINDVVGTVVANDPDAGDSISFEIISGNSEGKFAINSSTGQITVADSLDYDTESAYHLIVAVTDSSGEATGGNIFIQVLPASVTYPTSQTLDADIEFSPGALNAQSNVLYPGNTHVCEVKNLIFGQSKQLVSGATVQLVLKDESEVNLTGQAWPLTLVEAAPGHYWQGVSSAIDIDGLTKVIAEITVTAGGSVGFWKKELGVGDRTV